MSTCTRLDLQTPGSQPVIMPKNLPGHCCSCDSNVCLYLQRTGIMVSLSILYFQGCCHLKSAGEVTNCTGTVHHKSPSLNIKFKVVKTWLYRHRVL